MSSLQQAKDNLAKNIFGETRAQSQAKGMCIRCKQKIQLTTKGGGPGTVYSDAGMKDYQIHGMCEHCYDEVMS